MEKYKEAEVKHIFSSKGMPIMLDTNPLWQKTKARFIFDFRWAEMPESEEMVKVE